MATTTSDAGTCLLIRGESREEVELALRQREEQGYRRQAEPGLVGRTWMVGCAKPGLDAATANDCTVERIGHQVIIRGPSAAAARDRIVSFVLGGAQLLSIEQTSPIEWTAILDAPR